jgi:hypothetical protein
VAWSTSCRRWTLDARQLLVALAVLDAPVSGGVLTVAGLDVVGLAVAVEPVAELGVEAVACSTPSTSSPCSTPRPAVAVQLAELSGIAVEPALAIGRQLLADGGDLAVVELDLAVVAIVTGLEAVAVEAVVGLAVVASSSPTRRRWRCSCGARR